MRVGLSTRAIEPALTGGIDGIGIYTQALLAHLPAEGIEVQGQVYAEGPADAALRYSRRWPHAYGWYVGGELAGLRPRVRPAAGLMHFTDHRVAACATPSVATVHDAIPLRYPQWVSPRLRRLKNYAMRRMVRQADLFIAVSHYAVDELREAFGLPADRIRVVPNGIESEWLQPMPADAAALRRDSGLPADGYFLFVGTLQPRKNVDRILDAHAALPAEVRRRHPLVVIGRPGWRCEHTQARLQALGAGGEVVWLQGLRERAALRAAYAGALALAFPTLYEGFGIPVLEAFASRLPVLTSRVASLPEVAGDAALLVDPTRVDEIAGAMLRLAEDAALRERLSAAGHRRAQSYTWQRTAAATAAVYRELVPGRG
ncbi:glycosyltransferase family 4 protein [Verticiella sediminum]|uniref:Glycosyltransferase family 4 protein n=1 Tax=Verticiella sediminum TaxID=1247510 RepID=A0A556A8A0_9BURK|nr:glycosyltransferase family 1 protein [Verticiella sediminum]TSH89112.1 glycosyltransferase family 4 protein [Verticiella sediminum]